jgi:hypothetical protein
MEDDPNNKKAETVNEARDRLRTRTEKATEAKDQSD